MVQKGLREVHKERSIVYTSRDIGHAKKILGNTQETNEKKTKEQTRYTSKKERVVRKFLKW